MSRKKQRGKVCLRQEWWVLTFDTMSNDDTNLASYAASWSPVNSHRHIFTPGYVLDFFALITYAVGTLSFGVNEANTRFACTDGDLVAYNSIEFKRLKNLSSIFSVAIIDAHFYKEQTNNNKHKHLWQILLAKEWFSIHQRPWCRAASRLRFEICPGQQNTNRPGRMRHCNFTITNT